MHDAQTTARGSSGLARPCGEPKARGASRSTNFSMPQVIVFWEHVLILLMLLPLLLSRLADLPKIDARTWGYLIFSGFAGSAVGTVFFTLALKYGNPTVVNVILNIQPFISTLGAFFLFGDRLTPALLSLCRHRHSGRNLFVSRASHAHRRIIRESGIESWNRLRAGLRVVLGTFHCGRSRHDDRNAIAPRCESSHRGWTDLHDVHSFDLRKTERVSLWPPAAQAHMATAIVALLLLASISGGIPLLIYFEGLRLTRASTAGYFEMMQTLAAVCITWGFFPCDFTLAPGHCRNRADGRGNDGAKAQAAVEIGRE